MRALLFMISVFTLSPSIAQSVLDNGEQVDKTLPIVETIGWSKMEMRKAHTARFAFYLDRESRLSIQLINLIRLYPQKFVEVAWPSYMAIYFIDRNANTLSLEKRLLRMKPLPPLRPSFNAHLSAVWHAWQSGRKGTDGHQLFKERMLWTLNFNKITGENCSYGYRDADRIVFNLLIEEGIAGFGHDRDFLDPAFRRIGISIRKHKRHHYSCVMDLTNGNWIDWLLFRPLFVTKGTLSDTRLSHK